MIETNDFKILQNERNPSIFFIVFFKNSKALINSITKTKILLGTTIYDNFTSFSFKATSVKTFKQYQEYLKTKNGSINMPYNEILKMICNLTTQLKYVIENENMSFIGYNPENIIVFDNNKFAYISSEHLFKVNNGFINITYPFTKTDFFMSPEILSIKELPHNICYKSSYYSLGCLIIYSLIPNNEFNNDNEHDVNNIEKIMDSLSIKGTKLFGLLKRCFLKEPIKRSIIFI
jgi:serine/threonine protein kinase